MKDIKGYEGQYAITPDGRVWSYPKKGNVLPHSGKYLKPSKNSRGYLRVHLGKKNNRFLVHRLVALAYLPTVRGKGLVNHIDGDKQNNNVVNLEWCNNKENILHSIALKRA